MDESEINALIHDPMLLPLREGPYRLQAAYELVTDGCREEIVLDWGDSHLVVLVDADWDSFNAHFHGHAFAPTADYQAIGACSPWDRLVGKECDWTWVALNKQGYCDLIVLSFDAILPQVLLHAIASSIEVFKVSGREPTTGMNGQKSETDKPCIRS